MAKKEVSIVQQIRQFILILYRILSHNFLFQPCRNVQVGGPIYIA